jgi:uncharacterized repeat protein (TIGR01451 family)
VKTRFAVHLLLSAVALWALAVPAAPAQSAPPAGRPAYPAVGLWYVAPTGQDTNDCATPAAPCATINGTLAKAASGDTILMAIGTYTGTGPAEVALINKNITLSGGWAPDFGAQVGRSTIDGEQARRGVTIAAGAATLDRLTIQHGRLLESPHWEGGGIMVRWTAALTLTRSLISHNTGGRTDITGGGGGGGLKNYGTAVIRDSTISHNQIVGPFHGSAIETGPGLLVIENSTISGNTGAPAIEAYLGTVRINSSTITGNPGGVFNSAGAVTLHNSILAGNHGTDCSNDPIYTSGSVTSLGYTLWSPGNCTPAATDLVGSPRLGLLRDNGGGLPTHSLGAGSPAINAGDPAGCTDHTGAPILTDQRGAARVGRCDLGAYEADLGLAKTLLTPGAPGGTVTYQLLLESPNRVLDLSPVVLTDTLPAGLTLVPESVVANRGTLTVENNGLRWTGTVSATVPVTITFDALVSASLPRGAWITNTAESTWQSVQSVAQAGFGTLTYLYMPIGLKDNCAPAYFDDFSNASSGWFVGEDEDVLADYTGGEYRVLSKQPYLFLFRSPKCALTRYSVEVDMRWAGETGSDLSLIFGLTRDFSQYYLVVINTDYRAFALYRHNPDGTFTVLQAPVYPSPFIQPGNATNHVKITRNGALTDLEVNGQLQAGWIDGAITGPTYAGLAMAPYEDAPVAEARFDNFRITSLDSLGAQAGFDRTVPAAPGPLALPWLLPSQQRAFPGGTAP